MNEGPRVPPLTMNERIEIRHVLAETIERLVQLRNAVEPTGHLAIRRQALAVDLERITWPLDHMRDDNYRKLRKAIGRETDADREVLRRRAAQFPDPQLKAGLERLRDVSPALVADFVEPLRRGPS
jgi:hypothetical protein